MVPPRFSWGINSFESLAARRVKGDLRQNYGVGPLLAGLVIDINIDGISYEHVCAKHSESGLLDQILYWQ